MSIQSILRNNLKKRFLLKATPCNTSSHGVACFLEGGLKGRHDVQHSKDVEKEAARKRGYLKIWGQGFLLGKGQAIRL